MDNALIFDFETLSQNSINCVAVSCAMLTFDMGILPSNGYTYEELLSNVKYFKFNAKEQVDNYNRKIDPSTLEWWKNQSKEALATIKPSKEDRPLIDFIPWLTSGFNNQKTKFVFTRNNSFDPVIVQSICGDVGESVPYDWWKIRDTKSFIMGLTYGTDIRDSFIPPDAENKYVKHDPRHDIVLDVVRFQTLLYHKFGE